MFNCENLKTEIKIENEYVLVSNNIDETEIFESSSQPIELPSLVQSPTRLSTGKKSRPKQKSYRKKVETVWPHDDILKLIEEVKVRRSLWDAGCAEYKLSKDILWQEVADSISLSINDCKGKWANLRTTFNWNLKKLHRKNSRQSADEQFQIVWRYFKPMMFLVMIKTRQASESISSMQLKPAPTNVSKLNELEFSDELAPISPCPSAQNRSRKSTPTTSSTPSSNVDLKEMALEALQSLRSADSQPKDASTLLGEYIAAELKNLPPELATFARAKLRRSFNEILDEVALMQT